MSPERLSKFDAIFYYTDNRRVAMQIGVGLPVDGPVDVERYVRWVTPRINGMPKLRMQLTPAPFGLQRPAWTSADHFDISRHVLAHEMPSPGDDEQLRRLVEGLIYERLPHDVPLWRLHIINGCEDGNAMLLLHTHHCMADGEGIIEIFNVLLEAQPVGESSAPRASKAGLSREAHADRPLHGVRAMFSRDGRRRLGVLARYARARGPRFPFTRPASGRMNIAWRRLSLKTLQTISRAYETTATDVVLASLGAAVDTYAAQRNVEVKGRSLLLQIPANVRLPDRYGELGNELTMLPGVVPLGIEDPVERLQRVAAYNRELKELDMATVIHGMMGAAFGLATPPGQALLCKTMVSKPFLHMARMTGLPPQEHALMSSVVMPSLRYSIAGQSITGIINLIACQFNMGFAFSPVTYDGGVMLTLSVDAENFGNPDAFMDDTMSGIEELHERASSATGNVSGV